METPDNHTLQGPRISIIGTSGSGKSTLAARAAQQLGIPHVELDALQHGPNWAQTPKDVLRQKVLTIVAKDRWIIDGNHPAVVRDLVWARATAVIWVDPAFPIIMAQVIWRSLSRAMTGQELWNGNRERWSSLLDKDHPIRWALRTHRGRQAEFAALMQPHWLRLRSRKQIAAWLLTLPRL